MSIVTSLIKRFIESSGYTLHKKSFNPEGPETMLAGLKRLKDRQITPDIIVDLGAAQGTWTQKALTVWPSARYELVEPLVEQTAILNELKKHNPAVDFHLAVAGETPGEVGLNVSPDLDGSGVYGGKSENIRKVPVVTIDEIVANKKGNILIKFDTHGYEAPILKGAKEALSRVSALVIEVYGFPISPTCLLFHELSAYLDELGFRLLDIVDIVRRPGDEAFWQADAFYVRKDNPLFEKNSYA
jgi:FkbM family methyltransferase